MTIEKLPYKITFIYYPSQKTRGSHWNNLDEDITWVEDWFMVPRLDDIIYYNKSWWKVRTVLLYNNKVKEIHVSFDSDA